jgi:DNA polymerase-4
MISKPKQRKIIHIDMDCFYAAVEIRDNPSLKNKPVAVGGRGGDRRGVLCTCNYIARGYGVRSAMPTAYAERLCPDLILLPVDMAKYKAVARNIHAIFHEFTDLVEPLSLDEAYLDVSDSNLYRNSATLIAKKIRSEIKKRENLTASAGVAPNKFLAKIASGWKKPDGLFVIRPQDIDDFVLQLPVDELFGVGKVTAEKLHNMNIKTCADLQKFSLFELIKHFGKMGKHLFDQAHGIDHRVVEPNRARKSLSVEETFPHDIKSVDDCLAIIRELYKRLMNRIKNSAADLIIKNQFIKLKFGDFKQISMEEMTQGVDLETFLKLFNSAFNAEKPLRLIGIGVHFDEKNSEELIQTSLFDKN